MRKAPITVILLLAATALLVAGCKGSGKAAKEQTTAATSVTVANVHARDIDETIDVTGTLVATSEVTVGSRLAGRVISIIGNGKTGTRVKKGQVVARLDDTDAQIQLRSARAQERSAYAAINSANARWEQAKAAAKQQIVLTSSGIQNAKAALAAAKARAKQAETTAKALKATTNAQIAQARQAWNATNSRLTALKNGSRAQEKRIAENNVTLAKATYENDKDNFEKYQKLYDQGAVSLTIKQSAETKMKVSEAQLNSAQQSLDMITTGPRQEDIDGAQAVVDQAQAALDAAQANTGQVDVAEDNVGIAKTGVDQAEAALASAQAAANIDIMRDSDVIAADEGKQQAKQLHQQALELVNNAEQAIKNTKVVSPVDGVIAEQISDIGANVGANAALLKLTTNNALSFETQVSELSATRVRVGQAVLLTVDAMQGDRANPYQQTKTKTIIGSVECVVPVVDQHSRNFTVRVVVNRSSDLFPGMFARGKVVIARHKMVVTIPKEAMLEKQGRQVVYVVQDGVAQERTVTPGAANDGYLHITSGVALGEQVVITGQQTLQDGDPVTPVSDTAAK